MTEALREHERMALMFLSHQPDRIRVISDEGTLAAALTYAALEKRGLVVIDNADGMLVTITAEGLAALNGAPVDERKVLS